MQKTKSFAKTKRMETKTETADVGTTVKVQQLPSSETAVGLSALDRYIEKQDRLEEAKAKVDEIRGELAELEMRVGEYLMDQPDRVYTHTFGQNQLREFKVVEEKSSGNVSRKLLERIITPFLLEDATPKPDRVPMGPEEKARILIDLIWNSRPSNPSFLSVKCRAPKQKAGLLPQVQSCVDAAQLTFRGAAKRPRRDILPSEEE